MPSSWSASLRFELQFTGENINLWGDKLNAVLTHADYAVAGWLTKPLAGNVALTTANAGDDEARAAMLKFTGAGPFTVTLPSVSKSYHVWNACSAALTVTTGAGATATLKAGEICTVICDGAGAYRVQPTEFGSQRLTGLADPANPQEAATKAYVDAVAFGSFSGALPGQPGNGGKFLKTDGASPSWDYAVTSGAGLASVTSGAVTVAAASAADIRAGIDASKAVTSVALTGSAAFVSLTDASTVAWDVTGGFNATVTLGGNRTIGAPTNLKDGITYVLNLVQDATGSRIPSWNGIWDFGASGTPTLQTGAGKTDKVTAQYNSSRNKLEAAFSKGA